MKNQLLLGLFACIVSSIVCAQTAWITEIKGTGWDLIHDMKLDASGNAVVCGRFEGTSDFDPTAGVFDLTSAGSFDGFVAKYDVNGNLLWARAMGGSDPDILASLALDDAGNIALYGWFEGTADLDPTSGTQSTTSAGWRDGCVIKLDANGDLLWAFAVENTEQCYGGDIAFSSFNGDVVVTGYYETSIDLDPNGSFVLNADLDGIVEENTLFMARYDANGDLLWGHKLAGNEMPHVDVFANGGNEVINWCAAGIDQSTSPSDLDPGGGTVHPVAGSGGTVMHYLVVAQYDPNGNYIWSDVTAVEYSSAGTNPPDPDLWDLATDTNGNILIAGSIHQDYSTYAPNQASIAHLGLTRDGFVLKYDSNGALLWEKMVGGADLDDEAVTDVTMDASGNVWIVSAVRTDADVNLGGTSVLVGVLQETDVVVVQYDANGNYLWHGIAGGDWYDSGVRIAFWNGDAVLAGSYATFGGTADLDITSATTTHTAIGLYDGFLTRFTPSVSTSIATMSDAVDPIFYPNPANDRITFVNVAMPIEVFDAHGQHVFTTRERTIDVSTWAEGIYFLKCGPDIGRLIIHH